MWVLRLEDGRGKLWQDEYFFNVLYTVFHAKTQSKTHAKDAKKNLWIMQINTLNFSLRESLCDFAWKRLWNLRIYAVSSSKNLFGNPKINNSQWRLWSFIQIKPHHIQQFLKVSLAAWRSNTQLSVNLIVHGDCFLPAMTRGSFSLHKKWYLAIVV